MSLPILYAKGTTTFTSIGIGVLTDCLKCEVTREINGEYELTMEYPVDGAHFSDIQLECIITAKVPDKEAWQAFKIYSMSKPIDMTVTIDAEHITYMTGDIPLIPFTIQEGGIDGILAALSTIAIPTGVTSPFTFTDTLPEDSTVYTLKEPASLREVMSDMDGMLLSKDFYENCEWDYDNYSIVLTNGIGSDRSNSIKYVYGVNVSDLSQNESLTNTITGIMPYVHAEDDDGVPVNRIGNICYGTGYQSFANQRIEPVDVESYFTDTEKEQWQKDPATGIKMPTIEAVTAKGEDAIKDFDFVCKPEVSFTINPVDLTGISGYEEVAENLKRVRLGDIIGIIFEQYGIETTARIIRVTYDILNETNTSVDVGDAKPSLAATLASIGDKVEVNRAGIVINRDSIISYVNREDGKLGTRIQQTEDMISSTVYGEMTAWNMVPITGSHQYTGGEEWTIQLYSKGDPSTWYNAGSEYDGYKYFDNLTGAVWYCHQVSGVWQWDHCTWTYDHGRVASGTDTQMRAAANEDHWMYSWYNTSDNKIYYLERSESGDSYTYTWVLKSPQEIQLAGHNAYAERMDVTSYSNITQTSNQIVLKVDSNGHMALCELTESPDGHSQFNVLADDINFSGHTFNLSTDNMTIVSDTTVIDEDGYVVYYLCNSSDVGAVPLAGGLYYNKKIVMAFQDGDAGWSLEDRSKNAKSELRGTNFVIEQMYDKEDWNAVTDEYLNDQSSFPGKTKAYLSMNPRWFGMYHKNDQLSDTQKFDYRLGHFLGEDVSDTVGLIDQWWNGDNNPKNPDEAMFLMESPTDKNNNFMMAVHDQIIMAGGQYTSKQSPRMFRIRNKLEPGINAVMRDHLIGIYDYFNKKSPYQINGKPMYRLTNNPNSVTPGDQGTDLEDGCFIIVYEGPDRTDETINITIKAALGDTIYIKDSAGTLLDTIQLDPSTSIITYASTTIEKYKSYTFISKLNAVENNVEIISSSLTVDLSVDSLPWELYMQFVTDGNDVVHTSCMFVLSDVFSLKIYDLTTQTPYFETDLLQVPQGSGSYQLRSKEALSRYLQYYNNWQGAVEANTALAGTYQNLWWNKTIAFGADYKGESIIADYEEILYDFYTVYNGGSSYQRTQHMLQKFRILAQWSGYTYPRSNTYSASTAAFSQGVVTLRFYTIFPFNGIVKILTIDHTGYSWHTYDPSSIIDVSFTKPFVALIKAVEEAYEVYACSFMEYNSDRRCIYRGANQIPSFGASTGVTWENKCVGNYISCVDNYDTHVVTVTVLRDIGDLILATYDSALYIDGTVHLGSYKAGSVITIDPNTYPINGGRCIVALKEANTVVPDEILIAMKAERNYRGKTFVFSNATKSFLKSPSYATYINSGGTGTVGDFCGTVVTDIVGGEKVVTVAQEESVSMSGWGPFIGYVTNDPHAWDNIYVGSYKYTSGSSSGVTRDIGMDLAYPPVAYGIAEVVISGGYDDPTYGVTGDEVHTIYFVDDITMDGKKYYATKDGERTGEEYMWHTITATSGNQYCYASVDSTRYAAVEVLGSFTWTKASSDIQTLTDPTLPTPTQFSDIVLAAIDYLENL